PRRRHGPPARRRGRARSRPRPRRRGHVLFERRARRHLLRLIGPARGVGDRRNQLAGDADARALGGRARRARLGQRPLRHLLRHLAEGQIVGEAKAELIARSKSWRMRAVAPQTFRPSTSKARIWKVCPQRSTVPRTSAVPTLASGTSRISATSAAL